MPSKWFHSAGSICPSAMSESGEVQEGTRGYPWCVLGCSAKPFCLRGATQVFPRGRDSVQTGQPGLRTKTQGWGSGDQIGCSLKQSVSLQWGRVSFVQRCWGVNTNALAHAHTCARVCTLTHSEVEGSGHLQIESTILWEHGTCVKGPDLAGEGEQGPIQCFPLPGRAGEVPVQERTVVEGVTPILRLRFP